ncbi:hypothetical protein HanRHA438_Chr08g0341131 [Helianthus annuus]|uniref:Uncharacterized protein n=1 Tax=Helianthus annuus TaxID=4232 RepID=A0A9K3NBX5_HELAN|nr:hypothetical protein HanXRQr2_Chr08g0329931 [Helianthus annuus]KAJ0897028.1 hypothetical protein HanRHA438_Chr08g0341131 [Helianthus annuus]KAJ0900902.1 hypothetical protein HanPSC8_Chr08g0319061 [Helianthus annuus]
MTIDLPSSYHPLETLPLLVGFYGVPAMFVCFCFPLRDETLVEKKQIFVCKSKETSQTHVFVGIFLSLFVCIS